MTSAAVVFSLVIGLIIGVCDALGMVCATVWATGKPHRPVLGLLAIVFWFLGAVTLVVGIFVSRSGWGV